MNPERSRKPEEPKPSSANTPPRRGSGEFQHTRFTPGGGKDKGKDKDRKFADVGGVRSHIDLANLRRALKDSTSPEEGDTSISRPVQGETRLEQGETRPLPKDIKEKKSLLKTKLLNIQASTERIKSRLPGLAIFKLSNQLCEDIKQCLDIKEEASKYVHEGEINRDPKEYGEMLDRTISLAKKYEELITLLDRANPELQPGSTAAQALDKMQRFLQMPSRLDLLRQRPSRPDLLLQRPIRPSEAEFKIEFKTALDILGPETSQDYRDKHGIEEVFTDENSVEKLGYSRARNPSKDKVSWEFVVATREHLRAAIARWVDGVLDIDLVKLGRQKIGPDPTHRAEHVARGFLMYMRLGKRYGYEIKNYPLAEQYQKDYYDGICQSFLKGKLNINHKQEELIQVGRAHAYQMLLERDPENEFFNVSSTSYLEQFRQWEKMERKIKLKNPPKFELRSMNLSSVQIQDNGKTLFVKEPVLIGTDDFKVLHSFIEARKVEVLTGECQLKTKKEKDQKKLNWYKMVFQQNEETGKPEIWVLPYFFDLYKGKGFPEKPQHSIVGRGKKARAAADGDIDKDWVVRVLKGDSGHYEPYGGNPEKQQEIFERNKSELEEQGLKTGHLLVDNSDAWKKGSYDQRSLSASRYDTLRAPTIGSLGTTSGDDGNKIGPIPPLVE